MYISAGLPPAALTVVNGSKGHVMLETTRLTFLITALQGQKYQGLYSIPRYEHQVINMYLNNGKKSTRLLSNQCQRPEHYILLSKHKQHCFV